MPGRVVEIAEDGRHLAKLHGFLIVSENGKELGRIPLDDISAVIATAHGISYSNSILVALAERCAPLVVCASNFRPAAILWAAEGSYEQAGRMADQAGAAKPLKKRLWAQIVSAKIQSQGNTLEAIGASHQGFQLLSRKVRSGDPDNVEAQAARRYWPLLFGEDFRRDRSADGVNAMLNYAYTVLRAGAARAIMAAGLHPSLGLGPVDEVDSQPARSVIQDWFLGGGLGSRFDDGRGVGVFRALRGGDRGQAGPPAFGSPPGAGRGVLDRAHRRALA
jgi:CRISP-associated protein Cas1